MKEKNYTILVVDDSKSIRALLSALIKEYLPFVHVDSVSSSKEALLYIKKNGVDLILLDIMMPEIDGFVFAEQLKKDSSTKEIPIIFITASLNKDEFIKKGFSLGAVDYIQKPFDELLLANKINTYVKLFQKEQELKASYKMIYNILSHMDSMLMIIRDYEIVQVNKTFLSFFGCKDLQEFLHKYLCIGNLFIDDVECLRNGLNTKEIIEYALKKENKEVKAKIADQNGKELWFLLKIGYLQDNEKETNEYIVSFTDITQTQILKQNYQHQAQNDSLTNINNRYAFNFHLTELFENIRKAHDEKAALIILDIDNFKKINDQHGHNVGDRVLKEFTTCIHDKLSSHDQIARWGGEEFIILSKKRDVTGLFAFCEAIRKAVQEYKFTTVKTLTCSLGASPLDISDTQTGFIHRADVALYEAKNSGKNKTVIL